MGKRPVKRNKPGKPGKHDKPGKPGKKQSGGGDDIPRPTYDYLLITKFSLSIYLLMSYVLFGIATILFVFAVINLLYTQKLDSEYNKTTETLHKPFFFQYLIKKDVKLFMDVDGFILNYGGELGEPSMLFWIIFSIIIINLIAFMVLKYRINDERVNADFDVWKKKLIPDNGYFGITLLPYVFLLIVAIRHNVIQGDIRKDCKSLSSITCETYDKTRLKDIKNQLKDDIMNGTSYVKKTYEKYEAKDGTKESNKIKINIENILKIYNPTHNKDEAEEKRRVLGYVDRYFELLEYKSGVDDLYTYHYFTGLINPKTDYSTNPEIKQKYDELKNNIETAKGKQDAYYWTVIVAYVVICGIGILYFFINNLYMGWVSLLLFGGALFTRNRLWLLIFAIGLITLIVYSIVDKEANKVLSSIVGFLIVILLLRFSYTRITGMFSK